jgi:hypothetical protein
MSTYTVASEVSKDPNAQAQTDQWEPLDLRYRRAPLGQR